jgi:hypothetical protein
VVLDAESGQLPAADTLKGAVVQINVSKLDCLSFERLGVNAETVVLGGYFNLAGFEILDRVIRSVVAELQFVGSPAQC